ncbi:hypothetical protein APF79_11990 [bacterium BRH_c32]|nr:MAG: hypothetical protein APF79_11990 [bacterium BRH_c32]
MNTNSLKKFARESRSKLLSQVEAKLTYILTTDSVELRAKEKQIAEIRNQVKILGKENFVDKIAYTWFNRFTALRFMDINNHTFIKIVSPPEGFTLPEILSEAKSGHIDEKLKVDRERINKLLDGVIPTANPQSEVYKTLLAASCNYYNSVLPFMFERIEDYTELLLPDDLLTEDSVLMNVVKNLTPENCQDVEIIGWLYQFYISEKKDEVINAKQRYKTEEIPAATQLFTPHWIVKYIVENTLGRMWLEAKPNSQLKKQMEFYIEPVDKDKIPPRTLNSPEEIKFLDPASGSAHILVYAFELFTKIYEEEGYEKPDIPKLILEKNLFGLEIDERAAALGSFALTMKAASYHNRYLRSPLLPNIFVFEESEEVVQFKDAKTLGTLIRLTKTEFENIKVEEGSIIYDKQKRIKNIARILTQKFDCVVTNPPYVNSSYMNNTLSNFVKKNYKDTKADLFACFMMRSFELTDANGLIGLVTPFNWMFLKSFEFIRTFLVNNKSILSLIRPEFHAFFDSAYVSLSSFVLRNTQSETDGIYIDLNPFYGADLQPVKTLEAIQNPSVNFLFSAKQSDFNKIPGSPIAYWVSNKIFEIFQSNDKLNSIAEARQGIITGDNDLFIRQFYEVDLSKIGFGQTSFVGSNKKWFPLNKGGEFRKWYGNFEEVILYENDGFLIKNFMNEDGELRSRPQNISYYLKEGLSWSLINSSFYAVRYMPVGFIFNVAGISAFTSPDKLFSLIALLNTKLAQEFIRIINPTMNNNPGDVSNIPVIFPNSDLLNHLVIDCIDASKIEWNSRETSWDFKKNELLRLKENGQLQTAYKNYCGYWQKQFFQLHKNEEELNRIFIEIYGLQEELTPNVELKDITILKQETTISEEGKLQFNADEIMKQFISYAVGCMFGRYSLDKEGLILANQGETLKEYILTVYGSHPISVISNEVRDLKDFSTDSILRNDKLKTITRFLPDEDAIIPVLEEDYFVDDITGRFREFLKVTFGEENYSENIAFIEEALGKDIRKYFAKDFYADHIKRYKKRPIYWMFSSPKKTFNALIYMHRYQLDTVSKLLNDYLREFQEKLKAKKEHLTQITISENSSPAERNRAQKEINKIETALIELQEYEREILYPLAAKKLEIDLDDGVKGNYNKFGSALQKITGLTE